MKAWTVNVRDWEPEYARIIYAPTAGKAKAKAWPIVSAVFALTYRYTDLRARRAPGHDDKMERAS